MNPLFRGRYLRDMRQSCSTAPERHREWHPFASRILRQLARSPRNVTSHSIRDLAMQDSPT